MSKLRLKNMVEYARTASEYSEAVWGPKGHYDAMAVWFTTDVSKRSEEHSLLCVLEATLLENLEEHQILTRSEFLSWVSAFGGLPPPL